jgi:hypothetical protein
MGANLNRLSEEERAKLEHLEKVISLVEDLTKSHRGQNWYTVTTCSICRADLKMWYEAMTNIAKLLCATLDCINWMEYLPEIEA